MNTELNHAPTDSGSAQQAAWLDLVGAWLACRPTTGHPAGLSALRGDLCSRLGDLGFSIATHAAPNAQPVLIATRQPTLPGAGWVGLFAHYDVEEAGPGWSSDPFVPHVSDDRVYGRGVADNLGPLAQRILTLAEARGSTLPGLLWVIQGEEEIGSPFAHQLFPGLSLPTVRLWLEETGYFEHDGTQRLLLRRSTPALDGVMDAIGDLAARAGREQRVLDRYLNKAFGEARCPCLAHLVGQQPYLAIGPNDTKSRIHAADESLPLGTLALSSAQFLRLLEEMAACA